MTKKTKVYRVEVSVCIAGKWVDAKPVEFKTKAEATAFQKGMDTMLDLKAEREDMTGVIVGVSHVAPGPKTPPKKMCKLKKGTG